jgi:electron transport complex protein RnfG
MKEISRLCFVLTIIAAVSAGVLAFVSQETEEPIKQALLDEKLSAVKSVLPPFDNDPDKDTVIVRSGGLDYTVYRGRKEGEIIGAAFSVVAPNGYGGEIEFLVGVDPDGVITGIVVLKHLETPGLGAKIEDAAFLDQFKGTSLADTAVVWDTHKEGGSFKHITGATISSRAVTHTTARGLEFFAENRDAILDLGGDKEEESKE